MQFRGARIHDLAIFCGSGFSVVGKNGSRTASRVGSNTRSNTWIGLTAPQNGSAELADAKHDGNAR